MGAEPDRAVLEAALRTLELRDLSVHDLDRKLGERGFGESEREAALATLARTGVLDDERVARNRAHTLAARGAGNALIRQDLRRAGVAPALVDAAVEELEPEAVRARAVVACRGAGPKTARYLTSKGFSEDVVADVARDEPSGIG